MKLLLKMAKDAARFKLLYLTAIISTLSVTLINLAAPEVLRKMTSIIELGVKQEDLSSIYRLAGILLGLYAARVLFRFLASYLAHVAAWNLVAELRERVYDKVQRMSSRFFHDKQTGDLVSRTVNDTGTVEQLYAHIIPEMITNFVTIVGVMLILCSHNLQLALLTCIPIPFVLAGGFVFAKFIRVKFRDSQRYTGEMSARMQDSYAGVTEIQSFNKEEHAAEFIAQSVRAHRDAILSALKMANFFHPLVEFFSSIGTIIVVGAGGYLAWRHNLSVADFVAFLLYLSLFYAPVAGLAQLLENTQLAYAGVERISQVMDTESDIKDLETAKPLVNVKGEIEFKNVSFSYEEGIPILKNINVKCKSGGMLALVGPTGVGKTTFTKLIPRFYDPTEGTVLIDGQDIKNVTTQSLRQNIAPVLQDTYLFNGSVAENIAFAKPKAKLEEIIEAAKAAHIHDEISEMPNGYDTEIGERGLKLSGGQKQRIAIARAVLRKAPIIILDEATASVDTQTEREIQKAITDMAKAHTIIAIAHRLSTIQKADLILVLKDGEIIERGTHDELSRLNGFYAKLYNAQK